MPRKSASCRRGYRAARCLILPSQQSQMLSVMQERCSLRAKKAYALSMFRYLTPPAQLLMALLLLKSDRVRCTCPAAHTTPPGPSFIAKNKVYSWKAGWRGGWCRAALSLGHPQSRRASHRAWAVGAGWGWQGWRTWVLVEGEGEPLRARIIQESPLWCLPDRQYLYMRAEFAGDSPQFLSADALFNFSFPLFCSPSFPCHQNFCCNSCPFLALLCN